MSSTSHAIDLNLALERAGGNQDLARELYQMLQNELPGYLEKIDTLYQGGDLASLQEVIHKLNGASTYCGVPALKEAASSLESNLKQGVESSYASGVAQVVAEITRLQQTPELPL
ncbi:MAG: Hpt domain-containing protein [Chromatiales bacterium]|nr:Hpt domain-containing protein [Chromatiales bacterium]